jgi:glycosyltransferase involved in cell wall biosynthesis
VSAEDLVAHFGPAPDEIGGMATILNTFRQHQLGANRVEVHASWSWAGHRQTLLYFLRSTKTILRLPRGTVVHVHLSERGSFLREGALLVLARTRRLPTVATLNGPHFDEFAERRPFAVSLLFRFCNAVTCTYEASVPTVQRLAPRSRVIYLSNPVEVDASVNGSAGPEPLVLFAGEVGIRKGADVLAAAWPKVSAACPDARCMIVGPPTELAIAEQPGLSVPGPVPPAEVKQLLRRARCVALPSRAEALPLILLEAMAARRPFVSTDVSGIPSLKAGGLIVPVDDADALADALIKLLRQPELAAALGRDGQREIIEARGFDRIDRDLRALYAGLRAA